MRSSTLTKILKTMKHKIKSIFMDEIHPQHFGQPVPVNRKQRRILAAIEKKERKRAAVSRPKR